VLGPRFEENFRRAMLIARGDLTVFVERPISAVFIGLCVLLIAGQIFVRLRKPKQNPLALADHALEGAHGHAQALAPPSAQPDRSPAIP
jgi:TctA family transporter